MFHATLAPAVALLALSMVGPQSGQPRVNPDAALSVEFTKRVEAYLELHKNAAAKMPPLPKETTPQQIDSHQRALTQEIARLRARAQAGDIFTKEIRAYFRRLLEGAFAGVEGRKLRDTIMDENPGDVPQQINGKYPEDQPLTTVPPKLLLELPRLPEEVRVGPSVTLTPLAVSSSTVRSRSSTSKARCTRSSCTVTAPAWSARSSSPGSPNWPNGWRTSC